MIYSWEKINREIKKCLSKPVARDRIECLRELLRVYGEDGMILYKLGIELEHLGKLEEALKYYKLAYKKFPLEKWKNIANDAARKIELMLEKKRGETVDLVTWEDVNIDDKTLLIVNCTAKKAWNICNELPAKLPAILAYQGTSFHRFIIKLRELSQRSGRRICWIILSAKYGFLEPCSMIENYDVTFGNENAITLDELKKQIHEFEACGKKLDSYRYVYVYTVNDMYYKIACDAFKGIAKCFKLDD